MLNIDKRHLQIIQVLSSEFRAKHLLSLEELNWDNKSTCWFKVVFAFDRLMDRESKIFSIYWIFDDQKFLID